MNLPTKSRSQREWRKRKCFQPLSSNKILFTGTYQLGQAISYLGELINPEDTTPALGMHEVTDRNRDRVLRVEVQSRHRNSKAYKCFIQYLPHNNTLDGIISTLGQISDDGRIGPNE